jgi:hypothetical protein
MITDRIAKHIGGTVRVLLNLARRSSLNVMLKPDFGHDLVLIVSAGRWPAGSLFAITEVAR